MALTPTRGERNHNPGNLRRTADPWQGLAAEQDDREFFTFIDPVHGIRAMARTLIYYQDRKLKHTVGDIIGRWAPPTENDTLAYIVFVREKTGFAKDERLDLHSHAHMKPLVRAIIGFENGRCVYTDAQIDKGLALAGIEPPPKSMQKSRTVRGAQVAAGGTALTALADVVQETAAQMQPLVVVVDALKWVFIALTLLGIGIAVYARLDDRRKLSR